MTALAKQDAPASTSEVQISTEATSMLEVIARAARDPAVDIDKLERLLEMQERVHSRNAKVAYSSALADMQPQLPVISERGKILNKTGGTQSTYAYWEDVNEAIRPILSDHGFALSFKTGREGTDVTVTGILSHRAGHSEETTIVLPSDGSGSKNAVQAVGSSTSYGKRYTAFALLNITSKGEDDDGQSATKMLGTGEPAPRATLDGPHTSKSALMAELRKFAGLLVTAESEVGLDALLDGWKPTLDQCKRDLPAWWTGDGTDEKKGFQRQIDEKRASLGGSFGMLLDGLRDCDTKQTLAAYYARNEPLIEELSDPDRRLFDRRYEERESAIDAMDASGA